MSKRKLGVVFEGGKWLVKDGEKVLGKFGSEETAKSWIKEQNE